jgi:hypothetical protein
VEHLGLVVRRFLQRLKPATVQEKGERFALLFFARDPVQVADR